jgi:hypothetical protein
MVDRCDQLFIADRDPAIVLGRVFAATTAALDRTQIDDRPRGPAIKCVARLANLTPT